jgi:hypothetical protein
MAREAANGEKKASSKLPTSGERGKPTKGSGELEGRKSGAGGLPESYRNALFALLAVLAVAAATYVLLFSGPSDSPSDGSEFYFKLIGSGNSALIYDVRGAQQGQASAIYQCGVDIIGKGIFVGKNYSIIACESEGCIATSSSANGTLRMSYEQVLRQVSDRPYILVKPGEPGYAFFQRHMEITIGQNTTGNATCSLSVSAG